GGHNCKAGDVDGDGDIDLLSANHGWNGAPNPIELFRNTVRSPDHPIAVDDVYAVQQGGSLHVETERGVLANDVSFLGAALTAELVKSGPGTLGLDPKGGLDYTPPPGFSGDAFFRYRIDDGSPAKSEATLLVRVAPPPAGGLLANFRFDEGAGPIAWDLGGS